MLEVRGLETHIQQPSLVSPVVLSTTVQEHVITTLVWQTCQFSAVPTCLVSCTPAKQNLGVAYCIFSIIFFLLLNRLGVPRQSQTGYFRGVCTLFRCCVLQEESHSVQTKIQLSIHLFAVSSTLFICAYPLTTTLSTISIPSKPRPSYCGMCFSHTKLLPRVARFEGK